MISREVLAIALFGIGAGLLVFLSWPLLARIAGFLARVGSDFVTAWKDWRDPYPDLQEWEGWDDDFEQLRPLTQTFADLALTDPSVMTPVEVRHQRLYPLLQPPPDPDVWVDPDALQRREARAQFVEEFSLHCSAQLDEVGRMHQAAIDYIADLHQGARKRLGIIPLRARDERGRFVRELVAS